MLEEVFFSICYGQQWPFQLQLPFILFAVVTSKWNSDKQDKRTRDVQMKVEKILTCLLVDLLKTLTVQTFMKKFKSCNESQDKYLQKLVTHHHIAKDFDTKSQLFRHSKSMNHLN